MGMTDSDYTVVDVETTGLSPTTNDRIVELAVVYVSGRGQIQDRWSTLINPRRDVGPTHIHGITATDITGAPTFAEIAPYVLRAVTGRVVVAHNAPFDLRFLTDELVRSGVALQDQLPAVCTMQWSGHFLRSPTSRRLVDCCAGYGIPLTGAHSASGDALATAELLTRYLKARRHPPWELALTSAQNYVWPAFRGEYAELRLCPRGRPAAPREESWLDSIVSHMPRAAEPSVDTYLSVLEMALLDGFLAEHEKSALVAVAKEHGLSRGRVMDIHTDYLRALAEVALADSVVTPKEHADLSLVARLLGLPPSDVDSALEAARQTVETEPAVEALTTSGIELAPGDRIAFTGSMKIERSLWEQRTIEAGLRPSSVTRSTALLVAADPNSLSSKATKARAYEIPIVNEDGFARLLQPMQMHR